MTPEPQIEKFILPLDGAWEFRLFPEAARRMRDLEDGDWMQAGVPSSIFSCLIECGRIDPFELRAEPETFEWVNDASWIFRKRFEMPHEFMRQDRVMLTFDGLDTVTQIWLNEKLIGKTDNMFIPHRFDVTPFIKAGKNVLMVKFLPAKAEACRRMLRYGKLSDHHYGDPCRTYLRKAQYQFGSAISPSMPGCGIFRSVRIEAAHSASIEDVYIRTIDCNQHQADIRVGVHVSHLTKRQNPLRCRFCVSGGGVDLTHEINCSRDEDLLATVIRIDRPILWWPKGYGVPHLYRLKVQLLAGDGTCIDEICRDFGVRTIRLNRSDESKSSSFAFEVNEKTIYVRGANWLPLSRIDCNQNEYRDLLQKCADSHINMLRVWAGGYYEDSYFYELCDRLGIMVWQDFMFDSAYYPDRQWFRDAVEIEARAVIKRIGSHACLALWCGNSRIDQLHEEEQLGSGRKFYGKELYHTLLPQILNELDPGHDYIATTPFSLSRKNNRGVKNKINGSCGLGHESGCSEQTERIDEAPAFQVTLGMQSMPLMETLQTFCTRQNLYNGSWQLEKHNYQPGSTHKLAASAADYFAPPKSLEEAIWQSQVVQARYLKKQVEYLRTNRLENSGVLLWTLNDVSPSISSSLFDYLLKPKAAAFYAQRFFAPILITLAEEASSNQFNAVIINDSPNPITATLCCQLLDFTGTKLDETYKPVTVSPFSASGPWILPKSFRFPQKPKESFLSMTLFTDEKILAENNYFFCPDKYAQWPAAGFDIKIEPIQKTNQWLVELRSQAVVRDLQIIPPEPAECSSNFFTLLPGQPKKIHIQYLAALPSTRIPLKFLSVNQLSGR